MKKQFIKVHITDYRLLVTITILLSTFYLLITNYSLLITPFAHAQQSAQVILTWHANNFYPSDFEGKPSVTKNTPIELAAEVLKNNKFLDLSSAKFYWYIDGKLIERGDGLKEISYTATNTEGDNHFVRVVIKNGNENFETARRIPISGYELALEIPYPGNIVSPNSQASIRVVPYFFNIPTLDSLNFAWKINNVTQAIRENELILNIGNLSTVNENIKIEVRAQNQINPLEFSINRSELFISIL